MRGGRRGRFSTSTGGEQEKSRAESHEHSLRRLGSFPISTFRPRRASYPLRGLAPAYSPSIQTGWFAAKNGAVTARAPWLVGRFRELSRGFLDGSPGRARILVSAWTPHSHLRVLPAEE